MKTTWAVGAIAAVLLLLVSAMAIEKSNEKQSEQRTIPLSEIVTTSPQEELQHIRDVMRRKKNGRDPEVVMQQLNDLSRGSSNVFLVDANNFYDALAASFTILAASNKPDTPPRVTKSKPERRSHWLVAYLGPGPSTPTWWTIESVIAEKGRVVLSYRKSKPQPATRDVRPYYYWIPLAKLNAGPYELQLVDADKQATTLMRRVEVTSTPEKGGTR
jgi:hypothetical protein